MYEIVAILKWLFNSPVMSMIILFALYCNRHRIIKSVLSVADKVHGICSLAMLIALLIIKIAACYVMLLIPHISAILTEKIFATILVTCVLLLIDIVCTLPSAILALFSRNYFDQNLLYKHYSLPIKGIDTAAYSARRVFRLLN